MRMPDKFGYVSNPYMNFNNNLNSFSIGNDDFTHYLMGQNSIGNSNEIDEMLRPRTYLKKPFPLNYGTLADKPAMTGENYIPEWNSYRSYNNLDLSDSKYLPNVEGQSSYISGTTTGETGLKNDDTFFRMQCDGKDIKNPAKETYDDTGTQQSNSDSYWKAVGKGFKKVAKAFKFDKLLAEYIPNLIKGFGSFLI
jgi:hypothetical protein